MSQNMTRDQLEFLCREIAPQVETARVEKVYHPDADCLQLALFSEHRKYYLTLRLSAGLTGFYLAGERTGGSAGEASDFCMKLRSRLQGAALTRLEKVENDRVLYLHFSGKGGEQCRLVAELFPAGGNCYLLDEQAGILAEMKKSAGRSRGNHPGAQYAPAEPPAGLPGTGQGPDRIAELRAAEALESYNEAAALLYERLAAAHKIEERKKRIAKEFSRERKRLERLKAAHEETVASESSAENYRRSADILAANFRSLKRGQSMVHLPDIYASESGRNRNIPLEPALSPQENIERYYKKYKKLKSGVKYARAHLEEICRQLERLVELISSLEQCATVEEIENFAAGAGLNIAAEKESSERSPAVKTRLPYHRFRAADGSLILVGRGPQDNDELTFRVARGRDLWLHVSGSTGAHVVLSCLREGAYTEEALLDAAHLAHFYSSLKDEPVADVDYTFRKNVSRAPGLAPGRVVLSSRRTFHLRKDHRRLERLLGGKKLFSGNQ